MSQDPPIVLIYVTCPNQDSAQTIARPIIDHRQAACANIIPGMVSMYRWEGKVQTDEEVVLILKTQRRHVDEVVNSVVESHPYELPAILVLPVIDGHKAFLSWVHDESTPAE